MEEKDLRLHIKSHQSPERELDTEIDIPKEIWATRSPQKVAEFLARELASRWAAAKGFGYDSPQALNYYAGILDYLIPRIREVMVKAWQEALRVVREVKGEKA